MTTGRAVLVGDRAAVVDATGSTADVRKTMAVEAKKFGWAGKHVFVVAPPGMLWRDRALAAQCDTVVTVADPSDSSAVVEALTQIGERSPDGDQHLVDVLGGGRVVCAYEALVGPRSLGSVATAIGKLVKSMHRGGTVTGLMWLLRSAGPLPEETASAAEENLVAPFGGDVSHTPHRIVDAERPTALVLFARIE